MVQDSKRQDENIPRAEGLAPDVIVSPDALRSERIPPNQARTKKWPVLDSHGSPALEAPSWRLRVHGLVEQELDWDAEQFARAPRVRVFADMHCVTRWSRLGNLWEGVAARFVLEECRPKPQARFVLLHGYDRGYTTNLPLEDFDREDIVLVDRHDGEPLSLDHGGPVRLIVPHLYAWKSAKWIRAIEFLDADQAGFWERGGYHMRGDPWAEERFS